MRFVHAADIHLDSPLRGLERYDGAPSGELRVATRRAFVNLIDFCLSERVDALLLAGDVYDGDWPDFNTGLFFVAQMARLREAGIRVHLIHGNHDAASVITRRLRLPENVTVFPHDRAETIVLEDLGLAVHGQSFGSREVSADLAARYPAAIPGLCNVGLLHTALTGREGHASYAPTSSDFLVSRGYAYWALGHVHAAETVSERPWIAFPGNLQGRNARETGAKGFLVVTTRGSEVVRVERVTADVARWHDLAVDLSRARTLDDVAAESRKRLERAVEESEGRLVAARVRLRGRSPAHSALVRDPGSAEGNVRAAAADVSGAAWVEKVLVETRPEADLEKVIERRDAIGHVARAVRSAAGNPETLEAIRAELKVLLDKLPAELAEGENLLDLSDPGSASVFLSEVEGILVPRLLDAEDQP